MPFSRKLISFNWLLLILTLVLCGAGIMAIYSATYMREGQYRYLADSTSKQIIWFYLGAGVMLVGSLVDYRWARYLAWPGYIAAMLMLIFLELKLHIGPIRAKEVYHATSWIQIGGGDDGGGFVFQPAQLAILAGTLLMADALVRLRHKHALLRLIVCGAIMAPPAYLIYDQPDTGSTIVWIPVVATMVFLSGLPWRYLIAMGLIGATAVPFVVMHMEQYKRDRLTSYLHPEDDILGTGYNAYYSLVAIGSGKWEGKGYLAEDTVNSSGYLPATIAHNDFIFSVIGEEMGFRGTIVLVGLLCLFLISIIFVAGQARDLYGFLLCAGLAAQWFTHCFINLGMTITLVPITGLPLPLISYGGTFLFLTLFSLGLVQSVWIHRKVGQELTQPMGLEIPELDQAALLPTPMENVMAKG